LCDGYSNRLDADKDHTNINVHPPLALISLKFSIGDVCMMWLQHHPSVIERDFKTKTIF